jgi:hypothetical protein
MINQREDINEAISRYAAADVNDVKRLNDVVGILIGVVSEMERRLEVLRDRTMAAEVRP